VGDGHNHIIRFEIPLASYGHTFGGGIYEGQKKQISQYWNRHNARLPDLTGIHVLRYAYSNTVDAGSIGISPFGHRTWKTFVNSREM